MVTPIGYTNSPLDQGGNDTTDSDVDPTTGTSATVTLTASQSYLDLDAGLYGPNIPNALGNRVWWDIDQNGTQDIGEPGMAGVVVELLLSLIHI